MVDSEGKMVMRPKEGGFVIPARGTHELQPGGDHIMLMGVAEEVKPGARIPFTLTVKDGQPFEFTAVGKDFAGGKEDYQPGMGTSDGRSDQPKRAVTGGAATAAGALGAAAVIGALDTDASAGQAVGRSPGASHRRPWSRSTACTRRGWRRRRRRTRSSSPSTCCRAPARRRSAG